MSQITCQINNLNWIICKDYFNLNLKLNVYRIYHTIILDDPFDDPTGLEIPDRSPEPTKEQLDVSTPSIESVCYL